MKILLISFISLFMSLFVPLSSEETNKKDEFMQLCNNGYNSYFIVTEEETFQYYLQVVCGEYNNEISYSIIFTSSTPKEYNIALKLKNTRELTNSFCWTRTDRLPLKSFREAFFWKRETFRWKWPSANKTMNHI